MSLAENNSFQLLELLHETHNELIKIVQNNSDFPKPYLDDFVKSRGKMIRPALFFIFRLVGKDKITEKDYAVANSIELLHMASLVHDDIIDDSPLRRGVPSIQFKFGKDVAVYAGDYLFTLFFKLIVTNTQNLNLIKLNVDTMHAILKGELNQKAQRFNLKMNLTSYFKSIYGKTAAIFGTACYEGAVLAGLSNARCILAKKIGYHIGIIFQIYDDILDYSSTSQKLKKPVGEDLKEGVYTLPLILAYRKDSRSFKSILEKREYLSKKDTEQITNLINELNGIQDSKKIVDLYIQKIENELDRFNDHKVQYLINQILNQIREREINE